MDEDDKENDDYFSDDFDESESDGEKEQLLQSDKKQSN